MNYTKIAILENQIETQLIISIMEERKIPFEFKSFHDAAYDGLFQLTMGYGAIYAPEDYKNQIEEIINDIRKGYQKESNNE